MVSKPQKIVFYRIGAIGDIIHTLPLLQLTRELNPQARIEYIIGSNQVKELLDHYAPYIDKVHAIKHGGVFDKPTKLFASKDEKELIAQLSKTQVDEFIYLHSNKLKANLLNKRFIKAKKTFVYKRDESVSAVANYVIIRYPDLTEDLKENAFRVLNSNTLRVNHKSKSLLEKLAGERNAAKSISVVLGVGSLRPTRAYPLLKWIELIERILAETDYQINILGGPDEIELSKNFEDLIEKRKRALHYGWLSRVPDFSRVSNLIGQTSLLELAGILKNTDRLFSADTGILHIAAALSVSLTSVFSITSENRFGPFAKDAIVLRSPNCSCNHSYTNLPKHCHNTSQGYAKCMFGVNILSNSPAASDKILL
jgi:ADP-heptose:LPS heptosyltransferase